MLRFGNHKFSVLYVKSSNCNIAGENFKLQEDGKNISCHPDMVENFKIFRDLYENLFTLSVWEECIWCCFSCSPQNSVFVFTEGEHQTACSPPFLLKSVWFLSQPAREQTTTLCMRDCSQSRETLDQLFQKPTGLETFCLENPDTLYETNNVLLIILMTCFVLVTATAY